MNVKLPIKKVKYSTELKLDKPFSNKPFYKIVNDAGTVDLFLDAIVKSGVEDAKVYVSKKFVDIIDLEALKEIIGTKKICKYLAKAEFIDKNEKFKTNSVILFEDGRSSLVHLHLIKEPDSFGRWKIFGIEKE